MRTQPHPLVAERPRIAAVGLLLITALFAVACGNGGTGGAATPKANATTEAPTKIGTVKVSASGCTLDPVEGAISPGQVELTAVNETEARAGFHMWRIADGHTYAQFAAHIERERRRTLANKPDLGPRHVDLSSLIPLELQAGESGTLAGTVKPGTYGIVCARTFETRFGVLALVGPVEVE